ncbi:MAG: hypothetical protein M3487_00715 [Actinomycetota bacterium]|nr:hypothetical protein [Actinomycetota bacterium]
MLTKMLSTICVPRSRRKLRSRRGENCVEEICSATTVRLNTRPVTVIIVAETTISSSRAAPASPWNSNRPNAESASTSNCASTAPATSDTATAMAGSTHSAPPTYSRTAPRRDIEVHGCPSWHAPAC